MVQSGLPNQRSSARSRIAIQASLPPSAQRSVSRSKMARCCQDNPLPIGEPLMRTEEKIHLSEDWRAPTRLWRPFTRTAARLRVGALARGVNLSTRALPSLRRKAYSLVVTVSFAMCAGALFAALLIEYRRTKSKAPDRLQGHPGRGPWQRVAEVKERPACASRPPRKMGKV